MMRILLVLSLSLVLNACVKTRAQLRGEDGGGAELQRQTNQQRKEELRVRETSKAPAPAATPALREELDEQLRQMNGRIDNVENQVAQYNAAYQGEKAAVTQMAQSIDQKFLAYEEAIKKLEAQVAQLTEQVNRSAAAPAPSAPAKSKEASAFEDAEGLFEQKKWKEAIVAYQKYRDTHPKGKLYAEATYKIGICFQELKMKDEAKAFFDEVTTKYPRSREAKKAAFRAKQLK